MSNQKNLFVAIFSFLILSNNCLFSQQNSNKETNKINFFVFPVTQNYSEIENNFIKKFKSSLEQNNLFSEDDFQIEIMFTIKEIDNNNIVISIVELETMIKESIEIGKKAQIFYTSEDNRIINTSNTDEVNVKEYVSGEYLKQFRTIRSNKLEIINKSETEKFINQIVNKNPWNKI
ncbi:MAG: hypothetical protein IPH62_00920 [Ignavibacteriae bacterium]|nr:hypothetical protein [Ignavibacteriota bacterium]